MSILFHKKDAMIKHAQTLDSKPNLFITYLNDKSIYKFTFFETHNQFVQNKSKLQVSNRYYAHEIISDGQMRKPYLDAEKYYSSEKEMNKALITLIKQLQSDIIIIFKEKYNENITLEDILLLNSSGKVDNEWKLSLHIIVSPADRTLYYTNSRETDSHAMHLYTSLIEKKPAYKDVLDSQVYSKNQNFRIIGSHKKIGDDRSLQPIDTQTFKYINLNKTEIVTDDDSSDSNITLDTSNNSATSASLESDNSVSTISRESEESESEASGEYESEASDSQTSGSEESDVEESNSEEPNSEASGSEESDVEESKSEARESEEYDIEERKTSDLDPSSSQENEIDYSEINYMVTYIKPINKKLITPITEKPDKERINTLNIGTTENLVKTNINKHLLECIKKVHPSVKLDSIYLKDNKYYSFDYSNRKEPCPITGEIHTGTNRFYVFENERGYYFKCFSSKCKGKHKHIGYADSSDDFIYGAKQIHQKYLIKGDKILDNAEPMCDYIRQWLKSDKIKTLAVRSPMATGKTTMVKKILDYDKSLKKILWIAHRQTLTKQVFGKFKDDGFINYMDEQNSLYDNDRVIVQIDSLERIIKYKDNKRIFKVYDLVIIDEVEGNMNHYNSPYISKFKNSRKLFKFMLDCVSLSKKLLVIDADIGMRTKLFIDEIAKNDPNKSLIVNNKYKAMQRNFIVTNNKSEFDTKIFKDIKNNKNICIVSMSATALELIELELKKLKVNYVMHTSKTDDKLKDKLENVGEFWIEHQVVLYSPTIESGVDFNVEHFDKIYCIVKNGAMTCSQRSLLQMQGRIRQVKDKNVWCLYDGPTHTNSLIYTYDDVLSYFRYYESVNGKKIIEDVEYEREIINGEVIEKRKNKDITLFDKISILNEVEDLNKNPNIFLTVLNKLILKKGHTMDLRIGVIDKKNKKKVKKNVAKILADIDETKKENDLNKLLAKQKANKSTEDDKLAIKKIYFNKAFGIKNTADKKQFIKFYNKYSKREIDVIRYEMLFGYRAFDEHSDIDTYDTGKEKVRHKIIFDIVARLMGNNKKKKFKSDKLVDVKIDNKQYAERIQDIANNSLYFKDEIKHRPLFFKSKKINKPNQNNIAKNIDKNNKNNMYYMRIIQSLLEKYCIDFVTTKRQKIKGEEIRSYTLSINKDIKNIIEFKHNECKDIKIYKDLFKVTKT